MLGHKFNQEYPNLYASCGTSEEENSYTIKVASTIDEFTPLLESGFEYVSDFEGKKVRRKRK